MIDRILLVRGRGGYNCYKDQISIGLLQRTNEDSMFKLKYAKTMKMPPALMVSLFSSLP